MDPFLAASGLRAPRRLVVESWDRARRRRLDPERVTAPVDEQDLAAVRDAHPLAAALPVVRSLLTRDAEPGSGVIVAVGDAAGRLLWVEGDPELRRLAEGMRFVAGSDWSERTVGTSAPGTALALDHGLQIAGPEHWALPVRAWSCTAVPVHDLETHETIGVLDVTGGDQAVAAHVLPLLEATAAAVERELLLQRLRAPRRSRRPAHATARAPRLAVLGRDVAQLVTPSGAIDLSARHAELLTLLAWHRQGLSAERLAELVHGRADAVRTIRPEMVRLRRLLTERAPSLVPLTRPYRLPVPVDLDARIVLGLLDRGARRAALDAMPGPVLPGSASPGIEAIREEVASRLRESILEDAGTDLLLAYADGLAAEDEEVLRCALGVLPRRSPRRAGLVARLEALGR